MDLPEYIDRTEPSSPVTTTPFSNLSEEPPRSLAELKQLGKTVYKEVWDEFYDWEPGYCSDILRTAVQPFIAPKREVLHVAKASVARLLDNTRLRAPKVEEDCVEMVIMYVETVASGGLPGQPRIRQRVANATAPVIVLNPGKFDEPLPQYESCPPISKSVRMNDDRLQFMPYADDERFSLLEFQATFKVLEWSRPFDPDLEMIQIETVRRLNAVHQVGTDDIDRMKMFRQKFRESRDQGLLWEQSQRDTLHWPGAFRFKTTQEGLCTVHTPDADDLRRRLINSLSVFCPSLNCLHAKCETHGSDHASSYIPSGKPQLTGQSMILSEGDPCGPDCFKYIQDVEAFMDSTPHQTGSIDTLETILGIAPNLSPCQLAIICLEPCKQVFVQRLQLFPDDTILSSNSSDLSDHPPEEGLDRPNRPMQQKKRTKPVFEIQVDSSLHTPILNACAHPGPCTTYNCPCFVAKHHCTPMCRCGIKCERQWQGCSCGIGRCYAYSCSCLSRGRECIPGICTSCDARLCPNTKIQRLASQPVEIKCGTYGWGAFAVRDMRRNAFLGSYVGHIVSPDVANTRHELSKHVGLNYLFEIAPDEEDSELPIFDAAYLSNATRFLNHRENGNVEARVAIVNGEYQIGFFTRQSIKKGRELFIDYGKKYWEGK